MSKFVLLIVLLMNPILECYAQGATLAPRPEKTNKIVDEWVEGTIIYADGEVDNCVFSYNPLVPEGLLKIKRDSQTIAKTVFDVAEFYYLDNKQIKHHYISLEVEPRKKYFVEVLFSGSVYSLIGRKGITIYMHLGDNNTKASLVSPEYFFYLVRMKDFRVARFKGNQIYRLLTDKKKELKNFVKENQLNTRSRNDLKTILSYYHTLLNQ